MTPQQKIKSAILKAAIDDGRIYVNEPITADNVDEVYDVNDEDGELEDFKSEIRAGQVETGLPCESSRHYESKSVAAQAHDGSWVGWTYWYGGGKHGEPESIEWMGAAYNLNCVEQERLVVVREFERAAA